MIGGYSDYEYSEMKEVLNILGNNNVVAALSCGMNAKLVNEIRDKIGNNFMANCGGSIHGHPGGTLSGAKAMRQAIDRDFDGEEYKVAMKELE
jgi:ribulose-bisphosphate carboxylase large chain